nr:unnamed protein product [Callosobruchus analis]
MQEIKNSAISELDFTLSSLNSDFLRKVLYLRWQFAVTANLGYEFRVTPTTFSFANIATMAVRVAVIIYLLALAYSVCEAAFPAGLRSQLPIQLNSIEDIKFSCDVNRFNITLKMRQPFKGLLFAKDFSQECRMLGRASSSSESEDPSNKSTRSSSSSDIGEDISPQHQQPGQEIAIPIEILGTNLLQSAAVGPEIHAEIASRWTPFCRAGLDKDDRKSFMEKYPSPSNVEGLSPPVLNAEISACLTENLLRRDTFLSTLQRQITAAMSAIALPMNVFFSNPSEETNVHLHHLANGLKLLADVMHSLSRHRRYGLSNTMNNNKEGFQADQIQSAKKGGGEQKEPEIKKKLEEVGVPKLVEVNDVGCLCNFYSSWQSINKNPLVLDWVKGYKLPIRKKPTQSKLPENPVTQFSHRQIQQTIADLLRIGAISKSHSEFVSSFFIIQKPNGNLRFILNLKKLNTFLVDPPYFKLEDYRRAKYLIHKNSFLCKIDLRNAYYSVSIEDHCRRYLRVQYNGQLFSFNCLQFGLSMAPYIYTKILKPVLTYLRCLGIVCVGYLDDILLITSSYQEGIKNANKVVKVLTSLGFIINKDKCILSPTQECKFLGFTFNSSISYSKNCSIRNLAAYIGVLVAACPATQYGWAQVKLLERAKYLALSKERHNYNKKIEVPLSAKNDILTHRQYDYVLRKWWSYCTRHLLDPFSYNLQAVISFLAEVYKSGNSYSSVNTHKSALAMIITFKEEDQCIIKRV